MIKETIEKREIIIPFYGTYRIYLKTSETKICLDVLKMSQNEIWFKELKIFVKSPEGYINIKREELLLEEMRRIQKLDSLPAKFEICELDPISLTGIMRTKPKRTFAHCDEYLELSLGTEKLSLSGICFHRKRGKLVRGIKMEKKPLIKMVYELIDILSETPSQRLALVDLLSEAA